MKLKMLIPLLLTLSCNSPMNHRISQVTGPSESKATSFQFTALALHAETLWVEKPEGKMQVKNKLLVILKNSANQSVSLPQGYSLAFYSTMPSMGHPLANAGEFLEFSPGLYLNQNIRYSMEGEWKNELWIYDENSNIVDKVSWLETL